MEALLIHLLKSSAVLLLFLGTYQVFLKKETFFTGNRFFLIFGLLTSFLIPFLTITKTVYVDRAPALQNDFIAVTTAITATEQNVAFNWTNFVLLIYAIGVLCFSIRLVYQLYTIQKIKKSGEVRIEDNYYHVRTCNKISPFSFFKHIFYYPYQFTTTELNTILNHEKVHVRQMHSLDILLIEIALILQWFNPAIWLYKITVKQNLEFIADAEACSLDENKKEYQYLMLKQAMGNHKITIANPFFNSIIKKRIVMLNQNQSKRVNLLKLLFILPLLGLFLVGFNTEEVVKFKEVSSITPSEVLTEIVFSNPLNQKDIERISSGFGPTKSPFTNTAEFHNGIDLVASSGKDVKASASGIVKISTSDKTNGNFIIIEHTDGYTTKYAHLKDRSVSVGAEVSAGEVIGHVGSTGKSTGPHLHFEILKAGKAVNPASLVAFKVQRQENLAQKSSIGKKIPFKTIELRINKDTSDEELAKMKEDLRLKGVDFSYTVVHNDTNEIIDITLNLSGKNADGDRFSGNYNSSSNEPIKTILVVYDDEANLVLFSNSNAKTLHITKDSDGHSSVWSGMDEIGKHEDIIIKEAKTLEIKGDGSSKLIFLDGEQITIDEFENEGQIEKIISTSIHNLEHYDDSTATTVIDELKFKDEDGNEETMTRVKTSSNGKTKYVIVKKEKNVTDKEVNIHLDNDEYDHEENMVAIDAGDTKTKKIKIKTMGKDPLYIIDGKEVSKKEFKKLSPDEIATINVYKGEKASEKYGRKAKDGVIDVVTKKQ